MIQNLPKNINKYINNENCILTSFVRTKNTEKNSINLISSIFILNAKLFSDLNFKFSDILNNLRRLKFRKIVLFFVSDKRSKIYIHKIGASEYTNFTMLAVNFEQLFELDIIKHILINSLQSKSFYFIFEETSWSKIVLAFKRKDITLSGGSVTKRHMISPLEIRLSLLVSALFGLQKFDMSVQSYHFINKGSTNAILNHTDKGWNEFLTYLNKITKGDEIKLNEDEKVLDIMKEYNSLKSNITEKENLNEDKSFQNSSIRDINIEEKEKLAKILNSLGKETNNESLTTNDDDEFDTRSEHDTKVRSGGLYDIDLDIRLHPNYQIKKHEILSPEFRGKRNYHTSIAKLKLNKKVGRVTANNKIIESSVFGYLDLISEIIKTYISKAKIKGKDESFKGQQLIEETWLESIQEKINDPNFINHRLIKLLKHAKQTLDLKYKNTLFIKRFQPFYLNDMRFLMIAYSVIMTYHSKASQNRIIFIIANLVIYQIYKDLIRKEVKHHKHLINPKKFKPSISYQEFQIMYNLTDEKKARIGMLFINLLTIEPCDIFITEIKFDEERYNRYGHNVLKINEAYIEDIKNNITIIPAALPMICKPNVWSEHEFGGHLENEYQQRDIITGSDYHKHKMFNREKLFNAVNYLSSIKFEINENFLNYLENDGNYLLDDSNLDNSSKSNLDPIQKAIILKIAKVFKSTPFFLPVHSDWRGRIYTQSFFIDYQGSELSTALLQFYDGESLSDLGRESLYIFGANCYNENNIGKASFEERIQWVKDNYENIIKMDPDFIKKAESKLLFVAFSLCLKELHLNSNAIVKLPVFLDATCSGIQHLAALLRDFELASRVNITPPLLLEGREVDNKVQDIYKDMIEPINNAINKFGQENLDHNQLSDLKFNRSILKTSIMTQVYNVSPVGIKEQLKSHFKKIKNDDTDIYIAPGYSGLVQLNEGNLFKVAQIIHEQMFIVFPALRVIYDYFMEMTRIMVKLNLPISWITPAGLEITQEYALSKKHPISIGFGSKSKTMTYQELLNKTDNRKQPQAIIPNIIHSLDASHLINLINSADFKKFSPIITVHDCFGTHPNKLNTLSYNVKKEFVLIYSTESFLKTYHDRNIQIMKDNQYIVTYDQNKNRDVVIVNTIKKPISIPNLPKLGELDIQKIIDAKYMIN